MLDKIIKLEFVFIDNNNDGLKIYLQWSFDRTSQAPLSPTRKYYWNVVGFAIKIPESANAVEVEDYITSLKELKLLDVNFVGSDVTGLTGWSGVSNKTFINAVDPVLIPKSCAKTWMIPYPAKTIKILCIDTLSIYILLCVIVFYIT